MSHHLHFYSRLASCPSKHLNFPVPSWWYLTIWISFKCSLQHSFPWGSFLFCHWKTRILLVTKDWNNLEVRLSDTSHIQTTDLTFFSSLQSYHFHLDLITLFSQMLPHLALTHPLAISLVKLCSSFIFSFSGFHAQVLK